jgi:putative aldouronate transport system substrate-binding protein
MKKNSIRVIAAVMAIGILLAGCGVKNANENGGDKVKLKWMMIGPNDQKDQKEVFAKFNEKLNALLPDTSVDLEIYSTSEYADKWKLTSASGEKMDLAWVGWLIQYTEEVKKGAYLPLDGLLDEYAATIKRDIPESLFEIAKVDGKIYSVPAYQMMVGGQNGVRTQKELSDKYIDAKKVEEILISSETFDEKCYAAFEDYLKKLKENDEIRLGVSTSTFEWLTSRGFEGVCDDYLVIKNDTKVRMKYETEECRLFYKKMAEWYQKGYIRQDIMGIQNLRQDEGKEDGYVLWVHNNFKDQAEIDSKRYGFPIEVIADNDKYFIGNGSALGTAVTRTSRDPQRAVRLMELLNADKELYNMLTYGIEGTHYKKESDTRIETIGYQGQPSSDAPYGLWKWVIGNTFNAYETQADFPGYNDYIKGLNETAVESGLIGFKPDITAINNEMVQIRAIIKEFATALSSGGVKDYEDTYNKFIEKLKTAGSEKVTAEIQKQLDGFLSQK